MKGAVDPIPRRTGAREAVARARARQAWALLFLVAAIVVGYYGVRTNRPPAMRQPTLSYFTSKTPSAGMVAQVLVSPGQYVRKGQLLAVLDHAALDEKADDAFNNLLGALAQQNTGTSMATAMPPPPPTMQGTFEKRAVPISNPALPQVGARAGHPTAVPPSRQAPGSSNQKADSSGTAPAGASGHQLPMPGGPQVAVAASTPNSAPDTVKGMQVKIKGLQATIVADNGLIQTLGEKVAADQDSATAAQSLVDSLAAVATRSKADSDKSQTLLAEGVISANDATKSQGYALQAEGQLQQARIQAAQAQTELGNTKRDQDSASKKLVQDMDDLKKAGARLDDLKKHPVVVVTPLNNLPVVSTTPTASTQKYALVKVRGPVIGGPPPKPVPVDFTTPAQIIKSIEQAQKTYADMESQFRSVCIYAPESGLLARQGIRPGQMVTPGMPAFIIRH